MISRDGDSEFGAAPLPRKKGRRGEMRRNLSQFLRVVHFSTQRFHFTFDSFLGVGACGRRPLESADPGLGVAVDLKGSLEEK